MPHRELRLATNSPAFTEFVIPSEVEGFPELRLGRHELTKTPVGFQHFIPDARAVFWARCISRRKLKYRQTHDEKEFRCTRNSLNISARID
jgi:hypothetical protein